MLLRLMSFSATPKCPWTKNRKFQYDTAGFLDEMVTEIAKKMIDVLDEDDEISAEFGIFFQKTKLGRKFKVKKKAMKPTNTPGRKTCLCMVDIHIQLGE